MSPTYPHADTEPLTNSISAADGVNALKPDSLAQANTEPQALSKAGPSLPASEPHAYAALPSNARTLWFADLDMRDVALVGGKNASLGELTRAANALGIRVPKGFAIPATAFRWYMEQTGLEELIQETLKKLDPRQIHSLQRAGATLRNAVLNTPLPVALAEDITAAYRLLRSECLGTAMDTALAKEKEARFAVAVRSSATAEDLPEASFAGAQESFLNILGETDLLDACRRCFASLYNDRAISYRFEHGFIDRSVALSVGIQEMVDVSEGASGVLFTLDTETGNPDVVVLNAVRGLGEPLVQGKVIPDEYVVFKPTLRSAACPILKRAAGARLMRTVPADGGGTREEVLPAGSEDVPVVDDATLLKLARWGCSIEAHYGRLRGNISPMDIEWAWEGGAAEPAILQARPETVHARRAMQSTREKHTQGEGGAFGTHGGAPGALGGGFGAQGPTEGRTRAVLSERGRVLVQGTSIGTQIVRGNVRILHSLAELGGFSKGDILVTERTDPDWEPVMRLAAGIVTERGGRTCHAAIVSRELGVPAIVGAEDATRRLKEGQAVTLCCAEGERGTVYEGFLKFYHEPLTPPHAGPLRTKLQLNLSNPATAFRLSPLPSDGVGLVREEFLLAGEIGIHPLALLNHAKLATPLREQITALTHGYPDKREFFIAKLSEGVGMIAAAFYPRPVLLRFSDLKSNEYAHLVGGHDYEPLEENPMLGFRGASRYLDSDFREAFALECEAVRRVREAMGLRNLRVMIPFCRTPAEGEKVLEEMARSGLVRGRGGLEVWMMCEIPSNVLLASEFCPLFDGFSIGSNDLTQLTLGVDRDSSRLSHLFDERNPAVKRLIADFVKVATEAGKPVGICGQAPSDYPEFARFLVETGITSISVDPDALLKTREIVYEAERKKKTAPQREPQPTNGSVLPQPHGKS